MNVLTETTYFSGNQNQPARAEQLKASLAEQFSDEYPNLDERLVHQSIADADAVTSLTFAPLLLLPVLAEEKVRQAATWSRHQRAVRRSGVLAVAA